MSLRAIVVAVCAMGLLVGCGDDTISPDGSVSDAATMDGGGDRLDGGSADAAIPDAALDTGLPPGRCGDGALNAGEQCDDGNRADDDGCNMACQLECGDGMLQTGENCDPGITAGETGACPADCDDSEPCSVDILTGMDCSVACSNAPITLPADDDMCCPAGEDASTDNDCTAMCGNMILEPTETCEAGSGTECPTACDDMNSCSEDVFTGGTGTCDALCVSTPIIACSVTSDGCCPSGCDSGSDADCSDTCGDGVLDAGELCEDGSATPCPTSCDDGMACTTDTLVGSATTCNAECSTSRITMCLMASDGCCPSACDSTTDSDCMIACGNGVLEAAEECDDGNTTSGDGCSMTCTSEVVPPTAFRLDDLDIMDPHVWLQPFLSCTDVTNTGTFGQPSLNQQIEDGVQTDTDMDGLLELSIVTVFRPLDQTAGTSPMSISFPDCTDPMASTTCSLPVGGTRVDATATNQSTGTCLDVIPGTVRPYSPAVAPVTAAPGAPCFVSDEQTLVVTLRGAAIILQRAQVSATYAGSPASSLSNGLIRGFLTEADAEASTIDIPVIGPRTISSLLAGGMGTCASGDDRDTITEMDGTVVSGWWFYLYFDNASPVPYAEL